MKLRICMFIFILTPVASIFVIHVCSSANKCTKPIYYINISLHICTYVMFRYVSTSVRHHQGALLLLAKITCVASIVIDYKTDKIHKIHECDIYNSIYRPAF